MLENKETALLVKAKLERLRELLEAVFDDDGFDALRFVYLTKYVNADGEDIEHNVYELIEDLLDELDYKIAEITKKHLL